MLIRAQISKRGVSPHGAIRLGLHELLEGSIGHEESGLLLRKAVQPLPVFLHEVGSASPGGAVLPGDPYLYLCDTAFGLTIRFDGEYVVNGRV